MAMSLFLLVPDRYVKGKGTWGKKELSEHVLLGVIYTPRDYFCCFTLSVPIFLSLLRTDQEAPHYGPAVVCADGNLATKVKLECISFSIFIIYDLKFRWISYLIQGKVP